MQDGDRRKLIRRSLLKKGTDYSVPAGESTAPRTAAAVDRAVFLFQQAPRAWPALLCGIGMLMAQNAAPPSPEDFLRDPPGPARIKGDFTLVSIGDLLYAHPMADSPDREFQKVVELIRHSDLTIGNQEGVFFDLGKFHGQGYGNGLLWGEGTLARDMKAMGVGMVSVANNHATDWGPEGLIETCRLLDEAGIAHAGGGRTLEDAARAGVAKTPKGRVALVSVASTFKANAGANDRSAEVPARPGINILRTRKVTLVTEDQMAMIRKLATQLASPLHPAPRADASEVSFGDEVYRVAEKPGLHYDMDLYDHTRLLKAVHDARQTADLVVFTIHAHESPTGMDDDTPAPPDFLIKLFHNAVDAGADVIMGGGPHSLRGVEIYKGRPVFYGMGVFFIRGDIKALQETALHAFPDANGRPPAPRPPERSVRAGGNPASWYDGIVAVTDFNNGKAKILRLYPLDVGNTYEPLRRGVPHLADEANSRRILETLRNDSAQFGTEISIEGSHGVIRIP
jgi:poly-gamma-glutamate capsule biosynthesis protein CapA/YwtB (metallophosphatase superfamily)